VTIDVTDGAYHAQATEVFADSHPSSSSHTSRAKSYNSSHSNTANVAFVGSANGGALTRHGDVFPIVDAQDADIA
jgi:prepilin-type processing-associated H-X9-DG protein